LSTTYPLNQNSLNINQATSEDFRENLAVSDPIANSLVLYRDSLPGHQFASTFRLRHSPLLKDEAVIWNWQELYVRTSAQVAKVYFGSLIAFLIAAFGIHGVLRSRAPDADPFLLPIVFLLSGFGLMVALSVHDPFRDTLAFTTQALGVIAFGTVAILIPNLNRFRRLPLHRYTYAYAVAAVVLLLTLFAFGRGPAATHIQLFGFEPIEIIKVLLVFFIAAYLADRRLSNQVGLKSKIYLPIFRDVLPLIAIYLIALSLFGAVKDLGPAVLLFGTFVTILYLVTGQSIYPLLGVALLLVAGYFGDRLGFGFFATRVQMWLHPWGNSNRLGGQLAEGLWGLCTGGIFGSGSGLGGSYFVPRAGSDMAFTTIGEEYGLVGALALLCLYVFIVYRGFLIARCALDEFDRLLASGITVLIGLQALVITGGATGLMPLTGITLPFVSYGTSSLVANFFCIGILLNLSAKSASNELVAVTPPVFIRTSRRVAVALSAGLLLLVGVVRLVWLQGIDDSIVAVQGLWIPDADHIYREHHNPRLVAYAQQIPRGKILDRNGVLLADNAPPGQGVPYLANAVPRFYPLGSTSADIVFAVEQENSPLNPLGCDQQLRGYDSLRDLLPLYRRKDLPFPPQPLGNDVRLTLDVNLQRAAQNALTSAANKYGNGCGAAVVLNARTGDLLAAATVPTFDPNELTNETWEAMHSPNDNTLINRAFAGTYVPGSVFKLVTATSAFEQSKNTLVFQCHHKLPELRWVFNGKTYVRRNITDDESFVPHNTTDMAKALRVSCNVYFAQLGVAIGAEPIERTMQQYGLHECPSLQDLGSDLPDCAYGQGTIQVTPYQMAHVCQTIANDGRACPPAFVLDAPSAGSTRILSAGDARSIGSMMESVVESGTAAGVFPGLSVAGKTGSAQLATGRPHSWFVGFAPAERPTIAFACIVEHGGHGRTAAGSVCREIVQTAMH
jgi:cell division protein FtsW (lipid II flippase)